MDYYFVTIDGRPVAKSNMYGVRVIGKRGIIYTTKDLEEYELSVGKAVQEVVKETIQGYTSLYMRVYQHGKRWIDVDNCFKAIQDGLDHTKTIKRGKNEIQVCETGIANDKLFQLIIGERVHVESAEEQRIELILTEYKGLFHLVDCIKDKYGIEENYYSELFYPNIKE